MLCFNACLVLEKPLGNIFLERFVLIALKLISITIFCLKYWFYKINLDNVYEIQVNFHGLHQGKRN